MVPYDRDGEPMTVPGHRPYGEQLADTLAFAVEHIPWYRDRVHEYRRPMRDSEDLARLPIVGRADVLADQRAFASTDEWPASISYSSSTTGTVGQPRWRSEAEQRALIDLLVASRPDAVPGEEDDGVTLVIHPFDQGPPSAPAWVTRRVYVAMLVPWHFELIHQILRDGWESPAGRLPVTAVDCFSPGLRILTQWFEQRQIEPASFGVTHLFGYGSIQPASWRRRLEASWGADYRDLYGLSEVVLSDSAQCPLCHAYHFVLPIVPEVVDPITREPIDRGTGVLLLTELYPYAQMQLLVRYWTDDLVELAPPCPLGGFGFTFRGRRGSSVVVERADGPALVIGSLQVGEVCAASADLAIDGVSWAPWAVDAGAPRFSLTSLTTAATEGTDVHVTVELRYPPEQFPERATAAIDEIAAGLRSVVTGLDAAVDRGTVRLRVTAVGPGELPDTVKV